MEWRSQVWHEKHKYGFFRFFCGKFCRYKNYVYLCITKNDGAIAQLVEQRTENPCVPGSTPGGTTKRLAKAGRFFCAYSSASHQYYEEYRFVITGPTSNLFPTDHHSANKPGARRLVSHRETMFRRIPRASHRALVCIDTTRAKNRQNRPHSKLHFRATRPFFGFLTPSIGPLPSKVGRILRLQSLDISLCKNKKVLGPYMLNNK